MLSTSSVPWSLHEPQHSSCLCLTSLLRGRGSPASLTHWAGAVLKPCWPDSEAKASTWGGPAFSASLIPSCKGKLSQEPAWEGPPRSLQWGWAAAYIVSRTRAPSQRQAGGDLPPLFCLTDWLPGTKDAFCNWSSWRNHLLLLVLPERAPFSYWLSQKGGPFLLAVTEKAPFIIGPLRDGGFFCSTQSYLMS